MSSVSSLKTKFAPFDLLGKRAIVIGATAGIGRGIAQVLAERNVQVTVVGRNEQRGAEVVDELTALSSNQEVKHHFMKCDGSLVKNAKQFGKVWSEENNDAPLDYLVITQGMATTQGRTETSEGLDVKMSLHYYARVAFVQSLMPSLEKAADPRVELVLSAGVHSPYAAYQEDPDLKANFGIKNCADITGFYTDIAVNSLALEHPSVLFIHAAPGFVNSNWGTEMAAPIRWLIRGIQIFGRSINDCGVFMSAPLILERPTDKGWYLMDHVSRETTPTAMHEEAREFVWKHTKETLGNISAE